MTGLTSDGVLIWATYTKDDKHGQEYLSRLQDPPNQLRGSHGASGQGSAHPGIPEADSDPIGSFTQTQARHAYCDVYTTTAYDGHGTSLEGLLFASDVKANAAQF